MRCSKEQNLDYIVWVDPQAYYDYPYKKKPDVGRVVGKINHYLRGRRKGTSPGPGRIGTSSPELGVPVTYADISSFGAICEVAYGKAGYRRNFLMEVICSESGGGGRLLRGDQREQQDEDLPSGDAGGISGCDRGPGRRD